MQSHNTEDSKEFLSVSAALEATRTTLKLTQEQLAESKERKNRLLAIIESQTRLPRQKPPAGKKGLIWVRP
jgi:hypothetical protein